MNVYPRKRREAKKPKAQPAPTDPNTIEPPPGLTEGAVAYFREIARDLCESGVLCKVDRWLLGHFAQALSDSDEYARLIREQGALVKGQRPGDMVKNPIHMLLREARATAAKLGVQLGLTPKARISMKIPRPQSQRATKEQADPMESFLEGDNADA